MVDYRPMVDNIDPVAGLRFSAKNFGVEFYAEFLAEILRNTQNFGRNSAEKIGGWSLWIRDQILVIKA